LLLDLLRNLVAEFLGNLFALFNWSVVALLPHGWHTAWDELLDVSVLTDTARYGSALLGVNVLLDLLGLLTLFQFANLLLLVVADLFLGREWNLLGQFLANLLIPSVALLGGNCSWGGVALGVVGALTLGLLAVSASR